MGIIMPIMGTKHSPAATASQSRLADALFSSTQQRVLALLFGQPGRSFYANEIIGLAGAGSGAVQRKLARLTECGLITASRIGNQKHYQANPGSPVFEELRGIVLKTFGLADVLRQSLAPLAPRIHAAFVYGSMAKKEETASSDIDLMVISDDLGYADVFPALEQTGNQLGRPVNPTIYTRKELARKTKDGNAFVVRVLEQPQIWLIGDKDDVTPGKPERARKIPGSGAPGSR